MSAIGDITSSHLSTSWSTTDPTQSSIDLLAVWRAIFESSRSVADPVTRDAGERGANNGRQPTPTENYDARDAASHAEPSERDLASAVDGLHAQKPKQSARGAMEAPTIQISAELGRRATEANVGTTSAQPTSAIANSHDLYVGKRGPDFDIENQANQFDAASIRWTQKSHVPTDPSAECVTVFAHETEISIVVRNAAMTQSEALQCARRVSQELRGSNAALRQLTLNGRVIYQYLAVAIDVANGSSLLFAC